MWGRPPAVLLLIIGFLYIAAVAATRFYAAIVSWHLLRSLYPVGSPEYLLLSGLVFLVSAITLAAGLWLGDKRAWRIAFHYLPAYWVVVWLERGSAALYAGWPANTLFNIILTALLVIIAIWLLLRDSTKRFVFGESIE